MIPQAAQNKNLIIVIYCSIYCSIWFEEANWAINCSTDCSIPWRMCLWWSLLFWLFWSFERERMRDLRWQIHSFVLRTHFQKVWIRMAKFLFVKILEYSIFERISDLQKFLMFFFFVVKIGYVEIDKICTKLNFDEKNRDILLMQWEIFLI